MGFSTRSIPSVIRRSWREAPTDADSHFGGYRDIREWLSEAGRSDVGQCRLLDIGCGVRAPLSLLFAADGANVTAVDILPVSLGWKRPRQWFELARRGAIRASVRTIVHDFVHTFRYWGRLSKRARRALPFDRVHFDVADASNLPYPADSFDLIVSAAVWEHLSDVAASTREVNRCLRPGGLAFIHVALFPSLEGGHHGEWHTTETNVSRTIRPWDHLYPDRRATPVFLNGLREADYRAVFDHELTVIGWREADPDGAAFLSDEVRRALPDYSDKDLLTPWISVLATKRVPS